MEWKVLKGPYSKHYIKSGKKQYRYFYLARCVCGKTKEVRKTDYDLKKSTNCGCKRTCKLKHGMTNSREYSTWCSMKSRCQNKKNNVYKHYGGRGIKVCKEWLVFENFYKDMGKKPKGASIERIDVNGNYEKQNCRWANQKEQTRNTRKNVYYLIDGKKMTLKEIAEKYGICYSMIHSRIYHGKWSLKKAINTPRMRF